MISREQKKILLQVKSFVNENLATLSPNARLTLPATLPARDRSFLAELADELHLSVTYDEFDEAGKALIVLSFEAEMINLALAEEEEEEELDGEWKDAIKRVFKKFDRAEVAVVVEQESYETQLQGKMNTWKREYYKVRILFDSINFQKLTRPISIGEARI